MEVKLPDLTDATDLIILNPVDGPIEKDDAFLAASNNLKGNRPKELFLLPVDARPRTKEEWKLAAKHQNKYILRLKNELKYLGKKPRIHIFSHSPIPLGFHLGFLLSGWVEIVPYQYNKNLNSWIAWPKDSDPEPVLDIEGLPENRQEGSAVGALLISITHNVRIEVEKIQNTLNPLISVHLRAKNIGHDAIQRPEEAHRTARQFHKVLDKIAHLCPGLESLHVFYAGPLALAILLGGEVNPNVHPPIIFYDYKKGEDLAYKAVIALNAKTIQDEEEEIIKDKRIQTEEFLKNYEEPKLPILRIYSQELRKNIGPVLKGKIGIVVLHFLSDLVPLLNQLKEFGLDPISTFLVRKPYHYRGREGLTAYLETQGYRLFCSDRPIDEKFVGEVLEEVRNTLKEKEAASLFILEDGGYFVPIIHKPEYEDLRRRCVGAVEQTTKGIRRDKVITDFGFPIINVAESKLKEYLEAPAVGEALAQLLANIAQNIEQWHLPTVNALVLGCGSVGEKLTEALLSRRFKVTVYDRDPMKQRKAKELRHGPELIDNLEDLSPFRIVIGTTGETSLDIDALLSLPHNVILASGSSDRLEIDIDALMSLVRDPHKDIWMQDDFTIFRLMKENREIRLLCDGYPINFIIGEGISKAVIDPILAELIAGVAYLFKPVADSKKGIVALPQNTEEEIDKLFQKYHQGS